MTLFEQIKSMDIDQLAKWLSSYDSWEEAPWTKWFDEKYCNTCNTICVHEVGDDSKRPINLSYCELNGVCKFFNKELTDEQIVKLWLESESIK